MNADKRALPFSFDDGGRLAAGYKGEARDCVCRAICITTGLPYQKVYDVLADHNAMQRMSRSTAGSKKRKRSASHGISTKRKWFKDYMKSLGFSWTPTMLVGQGCKVHLKSGELPMGKLVVCVSKHVCAVIDGVLYDTHDCSRGGTRCVYGYYVLEKGTS